MKTNNPASDLHEYLNIGVDAWGICLEKSFAFLREAWENQWVGLPCLLNRCIDVLNLSPASISSDASNIVLTAQSVAQAIELECANNPEYVEPRYHNRLHTADVMTAMAVLLRIQTDKHKSLDQEWVACALLAAIGHDFGHPGQVNQLESEIESKTLQLLQPFLSNHNVTSYWCNALSCAILKSDFAIVEKNHALVQGQEFKCDQNWLNVFLNEADIMASASAKFGPQMGHLLSKELELVNFPAYQSVATEKGRQAFLNKLVFSSHASNVLNVNSSIAKELMVLNK